MTPNEKAMIEELFGRIRSTAPVQRDVEAERLIEAEMARTPGAAYALAQTVLVQDQALRQASDEVKSLEEAAKRQAPGEAAGSILSRVGLGGVRPGAVPRTGQAVQEDAPQPAPVQAAGAGGFLSGALQTAAGVAGGALLFEGVRSMFGGGSFLGGGGSVLGGGSPWGASPTIKETVVNEAPAGRDEERPTADRDQDADIRDASYETADDKDDDDDDGSDDDDGDWSDDGFDSDDTI